MTGPARPYGGVTVDLEVPERRRPPEHRCGQCFGPFGKSAIPCPREFPEIQERERRVAAYRASIKGEGTKQ